MQALRPNSVSSPPHNIAPPAMAIPIKPIAYATGPVGEVAMAVIGFSHGRPPAAAAKACELNRIEVNHQPARSSREVRVGDLLSIKTEGGDFEVEGLGLSDMRGPASAAQQLYRETEASREARRKFAEERKAGLHFTPAPAGRPSKRDRRQIHRFREDG